MGDIVNQYEDRQRTMSQMGRVAKPEGNKRVRGLESIYMQKFEKKSATTMKNRKPKFRQLADRFVDDPELLLDEHYDPAKEEISIMVADKLDNLQKQYMSSTTTN